MSTLVLFKQTNLTSHVLINNTSDACLQTLSRQLKDLGDNPNHFNTLLQKPFKQLYATLLGPKVPENL